MALYLEGKEPAEGELAAASARAPSPASSCPVLCGSAFKHKGVQPLLDAVVDFLPSPLDIPPVHGNDARTEKTWSARPTTPRRSGAGLQDHDRPVRGHADLHPGLLGPAGERLGLEPAKGKRERIGRLVQMRADKREEIKEALAGDIAARGRAQEHHDRRHALRRRQPMVLERMEFPEPVIEIAIEPRPRPTRRSWARRSSNWRRRTRRSGSAPIRSRARR